MALIRGSELSRDIYNVEFTGDRFYSKPIHRIIRKIPLQNSGKHGRLLPLAFRRRRLLHGFRHANITGRNQTHHEIHQQILADARTANLCRYPSRGRDEAGPSRANVRGTGLDSSYVSRSQCNHVKCMQVKSKQLS